MKRQSEIIEFHAASAGGIFCLDHVYGSYICGRNRIGHEMGNLVSAFTLGMAAVRAACPSGCPAAKKLFDAEAAIRSLYFSSQDRYESESSTAGENRHDSHEESCEKCAPVRILLLEDEEAIRESTCELLEMSGFSVTGVAEGMEAVKAYENAQREKAPFHVAVLDLSVPDGMGGVAVLGRLKRIDPEVKAIAVSGFSDDEILSEYRKYGFSSSLAKPYDIDELTGLIKALFAEGRRM